MKRVLFFLSFLVMSTVCFGQEESEHMTFMGIPIDGTMKNFSKKLQERGFTKAVEIPEELEDKELIESMDNLFSSSLKGTFYGMHDTSIYIVDDEDLNKVYMIGVVFPESIGWQSGYDQYKEIKTALTEKYGSPYEEVEKIDNNPFSSGESKIRDIADERSIIHTLFKTDKGTIEVKLEVSKLSGENELYVCMTYIDAVNSRLRNKKLQEDL